VNEVPLLHFYLKQRHFDQLRVGGAGELAGPVW